METAETAIWQRKVQEVNAAFDRAEIHLRHARQEYMICRKSRLPSPVLSEEGITGPGSYADENGCVPELFHLEDDAPEVEEVFGAEYAARARERTRNRPAHGIALQPQARPRQPRQPELRDLHVAVVGDQVGVATHRTESRTSFTSAMAFVVGQELGHGSPPAVRARGVRISPKLRQRQMPSKLLSTENGRNSTSRPRRQSLRVLRSQMPSTVDPDLLPRRCTRQSAQGKVFYELDHRGKPRLKQVSESSVRHQQMN